MTVTDPTVATSKAIEALEVVSEELQHVLLEVEQPHRACALTLALLTFLEVVVPEFERFIEEHAATHQEEPW